MQLTTRKPCLSDVALVVVGLAVAVLIAVLGDQADVIKAAFGGTEGLVSGETTANLAKFTSGADNLVNPAIIMTAAVAPLALLVGGAALLFGSRKGMVIIGGVVGALVFVGSVKGIVA